MGRQGPAGTARVGGGSWGHSPLPTPGLVLPSGSRRLGVVIELDPPSQAFNPRVHVLAPPGEVGSVWAQVRVCFLCEVLLVGALGVGAVFSPVTECRSWHSGRTTHLRHCIDQKRSSRPTPVLLSAGLPWVCIFTSSDFFSKGKGGVSRFFFGAESTCEGIKSVTFQALLFPLLF